MAPDAELDALQPNGIAPSPDPDDAFTPQEAGQRTMSSQATLPSTEVPASPIDSDQSFRTEVNDDRTAAMVIPSSLTPPPSTRVAAAPDEAKRTFSQSQQSAFCSPPATILKTLRDREIGSDYAPPAPHRVLDASADELRSMLQTCIAEQQKFKMETAHHKLQYNLLSLQAEDDAKRSAVEHEMIRREVDALRMAEHSRQARRELGTTSDSMQAKYLQMKLWYEAAMKENETLHHRLKVAKKVIRQKEEETISLAEERDMLLTRIRENREHFHTLCGPGGIYHSATTPKEQNVSSPQQYRAYHGAQHHTPRSARRDEANGREHGLSALLQAMSQSQDQNTTAPSTPLTLHRAVQKNPGRHSRNAQSMSSLPTTPLERCRDGGSGGLLPSIDLVPQTEPRHRYYTEQQVVPITPSPKQEGRRRSRESTISADDDNEELARQALDSVGGLQPSASASASRTTTAPSHGSRQQRRIAGVDDGEEDDIFDSQASQAAAEMLRRHPGQSFEVAASSAGSLEEAPGPAEQSARLQAKLLSSSRGDAMDKRKFSGNSTSAGEAHARRGHGSPSKKVRMGAGAGAGALTDEQRVGLGIQYGR
ncbi:hypothetical protein EsDP_00002392 [Epichloe bromicola]|uniref:FAD-dependent oxidoreductase-like enzyme n=1 Tax=Epichloe bromicola TaxID=79588 RepID=A0ABQ0CKM7_9HYPO